MVAVKNDVQLINALQAAKSLRDLMKPSATAEGAGTYHSLWKVAGNPAAGANPPLFSVGAGYIPTKDTVGAFGIVNAAVNGDLSILKLAPTFATPGTLFVYDRLWACSGFNTTLTSDQAVVTPGALPTGRDPLNGLDVIPFLEIYTAPGATAATWTLTGTDGLGNTNRTWTYSHPANAETIGQMVPFFPGGATPAAVMGCRQVTKLNCSISSGTAGDVGITLMRRLARSCVPVANLSQVLDGLTIGLPTVYNDACVALMVLCSTTSTGIIDAELVIGEATA